MTVAGSASTAQPQNPEKTPKATAASLLSSDGLTSLTLPPPEPPPLHYSAAPPAQHRAARCTPSSEWRCRREGICRERKLLSASSSTSPLQHLHVSQADPGLHVTFGARLHQSHVQCRCGICCWFAGKAMLSSLGT